MAKIVSLRATHRVAPTTLDVKGIVSATFTTPVVPSKLKPSLMVGKIGSDLVCILALYVCQQRK